MLIDNKLPVSCSHVADFFFSNSMVTVHIKPTAPHHTTVSAASVKIEFNYPSFTNVISVRLSKNLAKDGILAKSGRFTLLQNSHVFHAYFYILVWRKWYLSCYFDSPHIFLKIIQIIIHSKNRKLQIKLLQSSSRINGREISDILAPYTISTERSPRILNATCDKKSGIMG